MTRAATRKKAIRDGGRRQLNIRVDSSLYRAVEALAARERRSLPQAALRLIEEGLRVQTQGEGAADDTTPKELARLAAAGGGFAWLADEPDLYDDDSGEPI